MCEVYIYILLGLVIGYVGGFAGIGGAPFMVSFLVLVCGMSQLFAQANVLTVMLGPMSLLGILSLKEDIKAQTKQILIGIASYALFSYAGAVLAFELGENSVKNYFAILLIIIAFIQIGPKILSSSNTDLNPVNERDSIPLIWMVLIGAIVGVLGGLFGIGAGVLMVPVFISFFRLKKNRARALSLAILLPPVSIGGFLKYHEEGLVDFQLVFILFASYFVSNYFGARLGNRVSTNQFKLVYAVLLIMIAVIYLL